MSDNYCSKCGNTGEIWDTGERCECEIGQKGTLDFDLECIVVPEQYRGLMFNKNLLPAELGDYYANFMDTLRNEIISLRHKHINYFIYSPARSGKTVFAYSCMQSLFRIGTQVFPLLDALEIRRIIQEYDFGKKSVELDTFDVDPNSLFSVPYLFVKMPTELGFNTFTSLTTLIDRRLRRNGSTFILSNYSWEYIAAADKNKVFTSLLGDGSFGTVKKENFYGKE